MNRRRVYLTFTPYHLLLALALQDRDGYPDAAVLLADEAEILSYAPELSIAVGNFVDLHVAPTLELHPQYEYPLRCRLAAHSAQHFIQRAGPPDEIFISHGLRPEAQRIFRKFAGRTSFQFVEDGFDSYIAVNRIDVPSWHRALHLVLCGSPRARSHDMLAAFPYDRYNVIDAELCRAPKRLVDPIPVDSLRRATKIMQSALSFPMPARPITDLYLLSNSERMSDPTGYLDSMRVSVEQRKTEDPSTCVAVKAHPREKSRHLMAEVEQLGDYMVPHWVPAELLVGLLSPEVTVYGGLTTFIVSSRMLVPGRRLSLDRSVNREHATVLQRWDPTIVYAGDAVTEIPADGALDHET